MTTHYPSAVTPDSDLHALYITGAHVVVVDDIPTNKRCDHCRGHRNVEARVNTAEEALAPIECCLWCAAGIALMQQQFAGELVFVEIAPGPESGKDAA